MRMLHFLVLLMVALFSACSTTAPDATGKPPPGVRRVRVAKYDTSNYPATERLHVYSASETIPRHRVIALLAVEAQPSEEGIYMNAIAWKARQLGAQGLQVLPLQSAVNGQMTITIKPTPIWGRPNTSVVFRANALVFENKP